MNFLQRNIFGFGMLAVTSVTVQANTIESAPLPTGADCRAFFESANTSDIPIHCSYYLDGYLGGLLSSPVNGGAESEEASSNFVARALRTRLGESRVEDSNPPAFCVPKTVAASDLYASIKNRIEVEKELASKPIDEVVFSTLKEQYPC